MSVTSFDSLAYFEKLKAAGFTDEQARIQADALREMADERLVTRNYLDMRLRELEYTLTIKLGAMIAGAVAIMATLAKLL